jgi:hypothetical protein
MPEKESRVYIANPRHLPVLSVSLLSSSPIEHFHGLFDDVEIAAIAAEHCRHRIPSDNNPLEAATVAALSNR